MAEIIVDSVSLSYPIYSANARSLRKSLVGIAAGGKLSASGDSTIMVKALDQISFTLKEGDRVGLVGQNGAGKSTLLRLLSGIYYPESGSVSVRGKLASILNIGIGINDEATGYENIYFRGLILGLSKKEIEAIVPEIEAFTELGDYLSMPVRTYSSGMRVRLAFAISTTIAPEILILDEGVGAGDASFMKKAEDRLNALINETKIFLLASHANSIINELCNKVLVLSHGKLAFFGDREEGLALYAKQCGEHV